jgi:hypothetical protein
MPDLTIEKLLLFLLVVLPGFVAMKVFDLLAPPAKREFGSSIIDVISYGLINLAFWCWAVIPLTQDKYPQQHPVWFSLVAFVIVVVSPALLSLGFYTLRVTWLARWLDHPTRTAWDHFFCSVRDCWVLFHLKDGRLLGARYSGIDSPVGFVATFPQEPEIYVRETWRVDEHGKFKEKVAGTLGMVIRFSECQRIEFLELEGAKDVEEQQSTAVQSVTRESTPTAGGTT